MDFKQQPKPIRHFSLGQTAPSPHGLGQLCQRTLGIMRDFKLFWGGRSSSSVKLLVRDKKHRVKQISEDSG